jgi:hypothetical protein
MKIIHWGILNCATIARKFEANLQLVEGAELVAVGASEKAAAEWLGREISLAACCRDSYEA